MSRCLITAGPTREHIDDVRYLTNASSGRMGFAIATAALAAGHEVVLVVGPTALPPPDGPRVVPVTSALEMQEAVEREFGDADAVVMVAAVSDYRPKERIRGKRKKGDGPWSIEMVRNPDILAGLGERKGDRVLVGFALEAADGPANARGKLAAKNLDWIVLDSPATVGADVSDFTIFGRDGTETHLTGVTKSELAERLVALALRGPERSPA